MHRIYEELSPVIREDDSSTSQAINERRSKRVVNKHKAVRNEISKRNVQRYLCFLTQPRFKKGAISREDLLEVAKIVLRSLHGREDDATLAFVLSELVGLGMFEPVGFSNATGFRQTLLFEEHIDAYDVQRRDANIERLRARQDTLQASLKFSREEEKRLQRELAEQNRNTERIRGDLQRVGSELDQEESTLEDKDLAPCLN
ncbi:MAG: hypothetical protein WCW17_03815 [Patescibacteria group bacterium]